MQEEINKWLVEFFTKIPKGLLEMCDLNQSGGCTF
jgi:hypothetical protein